MEQDQIWNLIAKKLAGEATTEELQELERYLRNDPDLHYSMQTIIDLWHSEHNHNEEEAYQAFNRHLDRMQSLQVEYPTTISVYQEAEEPAKGLHRKPLLITAGSIIALLLMFFASYKIIPSKLENSVKSDKTVSEISTLYGSKTNLVLPDGTQVWLNAGSKISYDKEFNNSLREVTLTGEAFFDVAHNAEKPFIIHASNVNIKVLGTRFNVKSYPTDKSTEATLIRGSIEVSFRDQPGRKLIMKPNEKLTVPNQEADGKLAAGAVPDRIHEKQPELSLSKLTYEPHSGLVVETSWVENKLIFRDESFADLALKMERWYGVTIRFEDARKQELRFTGIFQNETIQQAMNELKQTAPSNAASFNYTIQGNEITIHK